MNDKNVYKKIKWYQRLLYIVPAAILFVCSFSFLMPKSKDISASAETMGDYPASGDTTVYTDVFRPDYIYIHPDADEDYLRQYLISPLDNFTNVSLTATNYYWTQSSVGATTSSSTSAPPSLTEYNSYRIKNNLRANTTAFRNRVIDYDFGNERTFYMSMTYTKKIDNNYTGFRLDNRQSTYQFYYVDFFYSNIIIPVDFITNSNFSSLAPTITFYHLTNSSYDAGKTSDQVYDVSYTGSLYSERGFIRTLDFSTVELQRTGAIKFFQPLVFDTDDSLYYIKDCLIRFRVVFPTETTYFGFDYSSLLSRTSESMTVNSSNYLLTAGIINANIQVPNLDLARWLGDSVASFFNMQLFPGLSFGGIIGVVIAISCTIYLLKFVAGG